MATCAHGQWQLQEAHTTADLRGVHSLGKGIAWASGTSGTVLRTTDDGKNWQHCAIPPHADQLDFRGIQAFDANTAIVMSSGKGDLSRLYKTTDGCQTWKLLFTNPDAEGFWDAVRFIQGTGRESGRVGYLAGDPVRGSFAEFITYNYGQSWEAIGPGVGSLGPAKMGEALFAASNSAFQLLRNSPVIVTGGTTSRLREAALHVKDDPRIYYEFVGGNIPLSHSKSAGAFSFEQTGTESQDTIHQTGNGEGSQTPEPQASSDGAKKGNGRGGRQAKLRELAGDPKLNSAHSGWSKNEKRHVETGNRSTLRNPPGTELAHRRGQEARKGFDYSHSDLQDKSLHQTQHQVERKYKDQ
jgi:hypothetical protein